MDISGNQTIMAGREDVWRALNDPDVLRACIPGCQSLDKTSDTQMSAEVTTKIGPVKAKFKGAVTLENINPPESYSINGEGIGGVAGFAKGGADVKLSEVEGGTLLEYVAKAHVGGKLAQLGSRLVESTARKMADEFFTKFSEMVVGQAKTESASPATAPSKEKDQTAAPASGVSASETASSAGSVNSDRAEEKSLFGNPILWGSAAVVVLVIALAVLS
ncbi:carbon monoxide dehydrogenase subunit G [Roseibium porphyridii]|uniref:Carbon monoxide dehydrogenase subunit G n=1 Tax=Roseibium porphyridii TaxID=2866279 RepID=A0ABY8F398_9HYPH|nr:carbon monoxide dehydrogenase subunit G [Roseibium sp. KMA01]WFE88305.1 carbon monoxide dehydrogenase subunit G [Roseibium sp. KMA01]